MLKCHEDDVRKSMLMDVEVSWRWSGVKVVDACWGEGSWLDGGPTMRCIGVNERWHGMLMMVVVDGSSSSMSTMLFLCWCWDDVWQESGRSVKDEEKGMKGKLAVLMQLGAMNKAVEVVELRVEFWSDGVKVRER
jgi:hypothetical protein